MESSPSIVLSDDKEPIEMQFSGELPQSGRVLCCVRDSKTIIATNTTAIIINNKHETEIEFDHVVVKTCWDQAGNFALVADEGGTIHLLQSTGRIVLSQKLIPNTADVQFQCISIFDDDDHTLMLACLDTRALIGVMQMKGDTENAPKRSVLRGTLPVAMRIVLPFVICENEMTKLHALCIGHDGIGTIATIGSLAQFDEPVMNTLTYRAVDAACVVDACLLASGTCHLAVICDSAGAIDIFDISTRNILKSFQLALPLQRIVACKLITANNGWAIAITGATSSTALRTIGLLSCLDTILELSQSERAGQVHPVHVGYTGCIGSHFIEIQDMKFAVSLDSATGMLSDVLVGALSPTSLQANASSVIGACMTISTNFSQLYRQVVGMAVADIVRAVHCLMMNSSISLVDLRSIVKEILEKHAGVVAAMSSLQSLTKVQNAISTALTVAPLKNMSDIDSKLLAAHCMTSAVRDIWKKHIVEGDLQVASILYARHLRHILSAEDLCAAVLMLPQSIYAYDCMHWIRSDVLPCLTHSINSHPSGGLKHIISICDFLIDRSEVAALPQDAVMLSTLVMEVSSTFLGDEHIALTSRYDQTHKILTAHAAVSLEWSCDISYEELKQGGIVAALHNMLWATNVNQLQHFLQQQALPTLTRFQQSMDTILCNWILDTTSTRVISCDDADIEEEDMVSYGRLAAVTSVIENVSLRARSILALYQVLTILRNSDANRNLSVLCKQLDDMASTVIDKVDLATREALLEAAKLEKLRDTAALYRIAGFDIRDKRQIRSVISLIVTQVDSPTSISDALSILDTYSSYCIDITSVLSKALVCRLLHQGFSCSRDTLMQQVIQHIPHSRIIPVFEDAVHNLLSLIEEQRAEYLESESTDTGNLLSDEAKSVYMQALHGTSLLTSIYCDELKPLLNKGGDGHHNSHTLHNDLVLKLKKMRILQSEFQLFLDINDISDESLCAAFMKKYAENRSDELLQQETLHEDRISAAIRPLRRLCSALEQSLTTAIHIMVKRLLQKGNMDAALTIASFITSDATTLDSTETAEDKVSPLHDTDNILQSARALGSVAARSLAEHSTKGTVTAKTVTPFAVSSMIVRKALERCAGERIGASLDILYSCDLVSAVCHRLDTANDGENMPASLFQVDGSSYMRDGILLSASDIIGPLLRHVLCEVQRRQATLGDSSFVNESMAEDLEKFVALLQQSENHLLALRILHSSWDESRIASKMVRMSTVALIRKILSYREIDTRLAVALLSSVPYEIMVRELKASAPSIQSDFSRLQIIASIGEELARMWEREELLLVFQSLQTNARWWHLLTEKGVKVDPKAFQHTGTPQRDAVIRAVVPDLLESTGGDLALATDYCSQFGIEAHYASRCYMEMQFLQKPTTFADSSWAYRVRATANTIEETRVLSTLRKILTRIHSLDYEKIRYVCTWLLNALTEQDILEECLADAADDGSTADIRMGVAAEADAYRKYLDLSSFLISVPLGVNVQALIPSLGKHYVGVEKEYHFRMPLWQLLEDPWGILEPVIAAYPETSARISPLCDLLNLDRDEFTSKRVMSHYTLMRADSNVAIYSPTAVFQNISDIISHVHSTTQQINIWRWIFEKEKHQNGDIAQQALHNALAIAKSIVNNEEIESIVYELEEEMIKMRCKVILACLQWSDEEMGALIPSLYDPMLLIREVLRLCIEKCWKIHIRSVGAPVLTVNDVCHISMTVSARKIVDLVSPVLIKVWELYNESEGFSAKMQPLESARLDIISKFLADIESSEGNTAKASGWDSAAWSSGEEATKLTGAEYRRRDDYFQGYAIAVLVSACSDMSSRDSYIKQMLQLVEGSGRAPATRLITARSRFRASVACTLLSSDICGDASNDTLTVEYISNQRMYLSCLAEMRFLRLTCSDESLLSAIQGSEITAANPSPLVSTWLRDEGLYSDVCELARDVLIAAQWTDIKVWRTLLHHMIQYGHRGALMHTLVICRHYSFFEFLLSPASRLSVAKEVNTYTSASLDKVEQMLDYLSSRNSQEVSAGSASSILSNFGITPAQEDQVTRPVVLSGPATLAIGKWEDPLEDMTLVLHRLRQMFATASLDFPSGLSLRLITLVQHKITSSKALSSEESIFVAELFSALESFWLTTLGATATRTEVTTMMHRIVSSIKELPQCIRSARMLCNMIYSIGVPALDLLEEICDDMKAHRDVVTAIANAMDRCVLSKTIVMQIIDRVTKGVGSVSVQDAAMFQALARLQK